MQINMLFKGMVILLCVLSVTSCSTQKENAKAEEKTGEVNLVFTDFPDGAYKVIMNNKTVFHDSLGKASPELGLNKGVMTTITFGDNLIALYSGNDILYKGNVFIPETTKVVYLGPREPYVMLTETETLLLD